MYINLPFRKFGFNYRRPVNIVLNLGTLEDICNEAQIEFHEVGDFITENGVEFSRLLLYHGYLNACKYDRKKPKFKYNQSLRWASNITAVEQAKIFSLVKEMFKAMKDVGTNDSK